MPLGRYQDILRADPGSWVSLRFWRFACARLSRPYLSESCPDVSAMLTTMAFDHSRSRWLGIDDLMAEPEGPSFISSTVAQRRVDRTNLPTAPSC